MAKYVPPGQPQYVAIANDLRTQIQSGQLQPGAKLPSEKELAAEWNVSGIVARQAVSVLKTEGLVVGRQGKGVFVNTVNRVTRVAPARYRRGKPTTTYVEEAAAARQALTKDARTVQIQAPEDPVTWSHAYEPLTITRGTPIEWPEEGEYGHLGIVDRFDVIGHHAVEVEEELVFRSPEPHEVEKLQMDKNVWLIEVRQTFRTVERVIEAATMLFPANRYRFIYRMPIPGAQPVVTDDHPGEWVPTDFGEAHFVPHDNSE
ncbi:GntR family transcriptional regulator [Kibdelosporangium lantanae]|uniref:GntR family transcriptional regulator n=1 Tax=Kibdelosporangium lantanae TaxID=1497396 RepID=A0ABW3MLP5_9PSEU